MFVTVASRPHDSVALFAEVPLRFGRTSPVANYSHAACPGTFLSFHEDSDHIAYLIVGIQRKQSGASVMQVYSNAGWRWNMETPRQCQHANSLCRLQKLRSNNPAMVEGATASRVSRSKLGHGRYRLPQIMWPQANNQLRCSRCVQRR